MEYRYLGPTGVRISPLCLGTWNFGDPTPEAEAIRMTHMALDAGINLIDTADMYGHGASETIVGKALQGRREKVILATKVYFPTDDSDPNARGISRKHIMTAVEASLKRLQTDHIDLYQLHRPVFSVPLEETLRALDDLIRQGKVRYIGSSTFPAWRIIEALAISRELGLARFVSEQPPYNLLDRRIENELVPLAQQHNLSLIVWSPLANGVLAGRYSDINRPPGDSRLTRITYVHDRINQRGVEIGDQVIALAQERGTSPSQLALLWTKDQPGITAPILGPRTTTQLVDALKVLEMSLNTDTASAMDALVPPGSAVADYFNTSGWMKMKL